MRVVRAADLSCTIRECITSSDDGVLSLDRTGHAPLVLGGEIRALLARALASVHRKPPEPWWRSWRGPRREHLRVATLNDRVVERWVERALAQVRESRDEQARRRLALAGFVQSPDVDVVTGVDKLFSRQIVLLDEYQAITPDGYFASAYQRFDQGLDYLYAIRRTRVRDASIAAYVDDIRGEDVEPDPDSDLPGGRREDDRASRMPTSVERALPRETRAGPVSGEAAEAPSEDGNGADGDQVGRPR
jgi:hypothetical protein